MKVYLDVCCLKRPFDDQRELRVRLETEAVLALEAAIERGSHEFVRSIAHDLENERNPDGSRRARVQEWLSRHSLPDVPPAAVGTRTDELVRAGLGPFDAFHLAWAERLAADVFVTVDDRLKGRARAIQPAVRVVGPVELLEEAKP